jgi:MFS family permease
LIGRLTKKFGEWPLVIVGPLFVTCAMVLLAEAGWRHVMPLLIVGVIANAGGRSLQTPALSALISRHSDPRQQGAVFGLFHMLGSLARALGPLVAGAMYTKMHAGPFLLAAVITLVITAWTVVLRKQVANPHAEIPTSAPA